MQRSGPDCPCCFTLSRTAGLRSWQRLRSCPYGRRRYNGGDHLPSFCHGLLHDFCEKSLKVLTSCWVRKDTVSDVGIALKPIKKGLCFVHGSTCAIACLSIRRRCDQEKYKLAKFDRRRQMNGISSDQDLPEACMLGTWPIKPRVQDGPCFFC